MLNSVLAQAPKGMDGSTMIIIIVLYFGLFYFLMIRPKRLKAKQHAEKINTLTKGAEVLLHSGIYGKIAAVEDGSFKIEIADKTIIKVHKSGILGLAQDGVEEEK